jgi:hypothetical protein
MPSWDLDPAASLAPSPLVVDVGGTEVTMPTMTAMDWLTILMSKNPDMNDLLDLIPELDELVIQGDVSIDEVNDMVLGMITVASGREWWITLRLLGVAMKYWDSVGPQMVTKIDPEKVSLAAWMMVLQSTLINSLDPESVSMFVAQVQAPPFGAAPTTQRKELTAKEFMALA